MSASIRAAIGSADDEIGCSTSGDGADGGACANPKPKLKSRAGAAVLGAAGAGVAACGAEAAACGAGACACGAAGATVTGGAAAGLPTGNTRPSPNDLFSLTGVNADGMRTGVGPAAGAAGA